MTECYICGRESKASCSKCYKSVCRVHIEEEKEGKGQYLSTVCSACKKKQRLNRIRIITVVVFFTLVLAIVLGVVFTSMNIYG